jgi:hypothetical protein
VETFQNIILTGRPASGKSEFIDFLKGVPLPERRKQYHIGEFAELDDFLWVWELGEADDIWEKLGRRRINTKFVGCGYATLEPDLILTDFMTRKMNRELVANYASNPAFYEKCTLFIEFARGGKDCYRKTFGMFDERILRSSAILFLNNSFEECVRRNEARYQEKKKHSILAHKVPDEELNGIYKTNDWRELTGGRESGCISIGAAKIPFVSMVNEPELPPGPEAAKRYKSALDRLFDLYLEPIS